MIRYVFPDVCRVLRKEAGMKTLPFTSVFASIFPKNLTNFLILSEIQCKSTKLPHFSPLLNIIFIKKLSTGGVDN